MIAVIGTCCDSSSPPESDAAQLLAEDIHDPQTKSSAQVPLVVQLRRLKLRILKHLKHLKHPKHEIPHTSNVWCFKPFLLSSVLYGVRSPLGFVEQSFCVCFGWLNCHGHHFGWWYEFRISRRQQGCWSGGGQGQDQVTWLSLLLFFARPHLYDLL